MKRVKGNRQCSACALSRSTSYVCLMGLGALPAKMMIVGEAPGYNEEQAGRPFVGKSGEVLRAVMKERRISQESDVYITNSVKCRPPENRTPKAKEIKACADYLAKEIRMVDPEYILCLGSTAAKAVFGETLAMSKIRGQIVPRDIEGKTRLVMTTFHPAASLYRPELGPMFEADVTRFFNTATGQTSVENYSPDYQVVLKASEMAKSLYWLNQAKGYIAFDIETTGLDPHAPDARVMSIQFGNDKDIWVVPIGYPEFLPNKPSKVTDDYLSEVLACLQKKKVIAHNGKFDLKYMRVHYGWELTLADDTMMIDYAVNENRRHGLKELATLFFGAPNYDIGREAKKGQAPLADFARYAALDVYYTSKLHQKLMADLKQDPEALYLYTHLLMPVYREYTEIETHGVYVDEAQLDSVGAQLTKQRNKIKAQLDKYAPDTNWGSTKQVAKVLFDELGLKPPVKTKTGANSTGEPALLRLAMMHPLPKKLLEMRRLTQLINFFIRPWQEKLNYSRLFPSFKIHGAVTGRLSCENPNLQQVPRDSLIRSLITAPPGYTFVEADFSQIELRLAAMYARDPVMLDLFKKGHDIHTHTAELVSGLKASQMDPSLLKEWRKKAKPVNFGFLYGMGSKKFLNYAFDNYGVTFTMPEAEEFRYKYFQAYPRLELWHEEMRLYASENGYVQSIIGRKRRLPDINSGDWIRRGEAERQAINSPVQGLASDLALMSVLDIHRLVEGVQIVGTVHDSILMEVEDERLEEALPQIKKIMEKPPTLKKFIDYPLPVPIEVEITVGSWGKGEKWSPK